MKEKFKLSTIEKGWILYDVGNSAFILMVSTLIPIFFNALAETAGIHEIVVLDMEICHIANGGGAFVGCS